MPAAAAPLKSAPLRQVRLGQFKPVLERQPDGSLLLRDTGKLPAYPDKITARLEHWAKQAPDRVYLAQRNAEGGWQKLTYREALSEVRNIAQALLQRNLSPDRPIAILSGNDIEQALLALSAMTIGVPFAPISPAYSLMSSDFGKLRYIIDLLTPGMIYASDGAAFGKALGLASADAEIVVARNGDKLPRATMLSELRAAKASAEVDAAHAKVGPDTIAKFLFTSGSTGNPKGVVNTQRMMCSDQTMLNFGIAYFTDKPPVIVDWLPWSHTFGGNHNFNIVLNNGGSLYIDDGNPTPPGAPKTARNLREISPTIYFNVPKGFEALLPHLRADETLRRTFFKDLQLLFYAGAGLNPKIAADYDALSVETTGERVMFITSLGSTETAPAALLRTYASENPSNVGVPFPGVEVKLVPNEGKLEARVRGPIITPGYWRQEKLTKEAFDEEGFYKLGDALKFADPDDPAKGLIFDGRLAEDFKLATGTWVSVGPLRGRFVEHFAPYARDVVFAGLDQDELTALVFPDVEACRSLCKELAADAAPATVLGHEKTRAHFGRLLKSLATESKGSSTRVCRVILLETPPSLDTGEATDKGSINQRAVLKNRAEMVDELYRQPLSPRIISITG
jgi:feruloyl-CoA synthase